MAGLRECASDALAGIDHVVHLLVAGGGVAVIAEADPLELGKFPRLLVGESDCDLDGFHLMSFKDQRLNDVIAASTLIKPIWAT